jgi:hypothetical protein
MPAERERARGGAMRYRTIRAGNGKYLRIAIVRKRGPHGGRTIAGHPHTCGCKGKGHDGAKRG